MIIFRADGNNKIGLGHMMRCLSIADAFRRSGKDCLFVTAKDNLSHIITERGYNCVILNSNPYKLDEEITQFLQVPKDYSVEAVIVDSYYVTEKYLNAIKNAYYTVYIDDVYSFAYPVDCLVNYGINASKEQYNSLYEGKAFPKTLLGTDYVPLRSEFCDLERREQPAAIKNIFVSTGGSDPNHIALSLTELLKKTDEYNKYTFHIVVGAANYDRDKIINLSKEIENISVYSNVSKISKLMLMCDAAISAAGSTMFELCACGLPIVTYTIADNQFENAKAFCKKGIAVSAGDARNNSDFLKTLLEVADKTFSDTDKCKLMSSSACNMVDGKGADRLAQSLTELFF